MVPYLDIESIAKSNRETIGLLVFVVAALTFIHIIKAKNKAGLSHLRTQQIDHVYKLVKFLNETKIEIMLSTLYKSGASSAGGTTYLFNIFELAKYDKIDSGLANIQYDDEVVLLKSNSNQIIDIKAFIDDPLTPKTIADELLKFHTSQGVYISFVELTEERTEFIEIITEIFLPGITIYGEHSRFIQGNAQCMRSWLDLKESAALLKKCIADWLSANGINENNIREDFKTFT